MKKKIVAVVLCLALAFTGSITVFAAAFTVPSFGDVVTAVQADLNDRVQGTNAAVRLSISLLRVLTEKAKNTEITVDDVRTFMDEASALLGKVYEKMGSYAQELLEKAKDKVEDSFKPSVPPQEPDTPSQPAQPGEPGTPADPVQPDKPDTPEEPAETVTFADLSDVLKKYVFVKVENAEDVAALIAESCNFTYTTVNGEDGTVYIRVNIEENPQIFNYAVFRSLVEDLYAQQGEEMLKNGDGEVDYLMSYEHIAGELALHALIYAVSNELLRVTGIQSSRLFSLYKSAAQADLNIDEARAPSELLALIGTVLMNFMSYHLLHAFGLI